MLSYVGDTMSNLLHQTAFFNLTWGNYLMIVIACVFLYLAIKKGYEPLLLVPIAFGMLLVNIYPDIIASPEETSNGVGGLLYYFYTLDEWSILPSLIFLGVGAMTDFGPLIANPISFLLGAAAQFGIFGAYLLAILMGFNDKGAAAVSIIGGADGPTSIFLAGKLGQAALMGPIAVAAYSYMSLVPIIQPPIMKLFTTKKERAAQDEDVRGAGRIHLHRQHLPLHVGLAGLLDEDRLPVDHPRGDEHSADPGTRRRARDLHFLGDDLGPQGERQGARSGAVCRTDHHSVPAALRQRQRHLPVLYQINAEPMANRTAEKTEACAAALRRHRFEAEVVKDAEAAFALMKAVVEAENPQLVSFGDSMTMRGTGIVEWLRSNGRLTLLDGFDASKPYEERLEIRRRALLSDLFITGVNAVTEQGTLHWLDKVGNRIAPVAFGPRKVIIVAGRNKIVADRDEAEERIRRIAAPQNVARHPGFRTPCAKTGVCADCNSQDRICNTRMEMLRCWPDKRVLVILIDEDSGL